ncbi:response regulator [Cryobacterium aureum]|uniref:response regulator n=1 Tax=Cryobacterium aureum TaxID=995037 RepID=UPI000CF47E7C|nr:response regulator [Cryobacterium aureum]
MNTVHPAGSADHRVEDDSQPPVAPLGGPSAPDGSSPSLSVEVLNERLRDQQFYTRSLIESSIDALMTTDTKGVITDVNQQMLALTGRTRDELIGAPCRNFFTDPTRADTVIARVLKENRITDYELTVRSFDGTETVVSYNAATLRDRERRVQGVFAAARDVTESKRLERALLEKNFDMVQANVARAEFLTRAKVEVLRPLQAIVSTAKALSRGADGTLQEAQQSRVDGICADTASLLSLLTELISMSTVETGNVDFIYELVDVHNLLVTSVALVDQSGDPAVSVAVNGAEHLRDFPLDTETTGQILAVLLGNAVAASKGKGVSVQARVVPRSSVGDLDGHRQHWSAPLPKSSYEEFLEIRVTHSGAGISEGDLPSLFLPLRHGEFDAAWKSSGNGVGLAMVKLLAELQQGTVGVEGALNEGATFGVWLPRRDLSAASAPPSRTSQSSTRRAEVRAEDSNEFESVQTGSDASPEPEGENGDALLQPATQELIVATSADSSVALQGLAEAVAGFTAPSGSSTALVVEDDAKSAKLLRVLLEAEGFQVITAPSGEEALDLAQRVPLSLITLDVQLPGMDGWKFLLKLHDSPELASIPVVVIAGLADMSMALSRGAAAVLEKPLQRAELQNSLTLLGLRPDRAHTRCILIVDEDRQTVDRVASYLEEPAYRVESSASGEAAIFDALTLTPDLILINLMMEHLGGFKIVRALQDHASTQHIPVLVLSARKITEEEQDMIDSDPAQPAVAMNKPDFNRDALLAEIKRALD